MFSEGEEGRIQRQLTRGRSDRFAVYWKLASRWLCAATYILPYDTSARTDVWSPFWRRFGIHVAPSLPMFSLPRACHEALRVELGTSIILQTARSRALTYTYGPSPLQASPTCRTLHNYALLEAEECKIDKVGLRIVFTFCPYSGLLGVCSLLFRTLWLRISLMNTTASKASSCPSEQRYMRHGLGQVGEQQ